MCSIFFSFLAAPINFCKASTITLCSSNMRGNSAFSVSVISKTCVISELILPSASAGKSPSGGRAYLSSLSKWLCSASATSLAAAPVSPPDAMAFSRSTCNSSCSTCIACGMLNSIMFLLVKWVITKNQKTLLSYICGFSYLCNLDNYPHHLVGEAPFIVIPAQDLYQITVNYPGHP